VTFVIDPIDDPVIASPSAVQTLELEPKRVAGLARVPGKRSVDELDCCGGHLFG